jgi:hypothetical protein
MIVAPVGKRAAVGLLDYEPAQPQLVVRVHENRGYRETGLVNPPHCRERHRKRASLAGKMEMELEIVSRHDSFQAQARPAGNGKIKDSSIPNYRPLLDTGTDALDDKPRPNSLIHE